MLNKGTVMKKYSKLYNDIKEQIITGQLSHGDKIPSVRDAAMGVEVHPLLTAVLSNQTAYESFKSLITAHFFKKSPNLLIINIIYYTIYL